MTNSQLDPNPHGISQQLEHIRPVSDTSYQKALEDRLITDWYHPSKSKKRQRIKWFRLPSSLVASLVMIILAGVIVLAVIHKSYLPNIPASPISLSSFVTLDANVDRMTAVLEANPEEGYTLGDVIQVSATIERKHLDTIPEPIRQDITDLFDTYQSDSLTLLVVENLTITEQQKKIGLIVLQVHPTQAILLMWLVDSQIPYKIDRVS